MTDTGRYALIIGNSKYTDPTLQQLLTPGQDVEALAEVLKNPEIGNFNIEVRLDIESNHLRREIERFFRKRKSKDTLLFYFSGHGLLDDYPRQLYLAVKDTEKDTPDATAISSDFILRNVGRSPAASKVIILDCCYSGAITDEMLIKSPPEVTIGKQFKGKGVAFLSASTAWQYAFQETDIKGLNQDTQSLFTRFLVQGLETGGADLDEDGLISVNELYEYIFELVQKTTPNQTPEISISDQQGDIVIANSIKSKFRDIDETFLTPATEEQHYPIHIEGLYQLALSYYQAEDWSAAVKWFNEVVKEAPLYKDVPFRLKEVEKHSKLTVLYQQGQEAFKAKNWRVAFDCFQKIIRIDPNYRDVTNLYEQAHKQIELPKLYSQASAQMHSEQWSGAIKTLTNLYDLDPRYRGVASLLEEAQRKEKIEQEYELASRQYAKAERSEQEVDWHEANALLEKIANKEPGYKTVGAKLAHAKRRLKFFALYGKGKEYYTREEWAEAVTHLTQATDLDPYYADLSNMLTLAQAKLREQEVIKHREMLKFYEAGNEYYQREDWKNAITYFEKASAIESNHANLLIKLNTARKKLKQQRINRVLIAIVNVFILGVVFAVFQNQIGAIGDYLVRQWFENGTISTFDKVEILLDKELISDLSQLPTLHAGRKVNFKVSIVDTDGKKYESDDLVCSWSVIPLSSEDKGIDTDLCETLYIPSRKFITQTVILEIKGLEQQFQPAPPIVMRFNITQ